jgi:hypothetical protein
MNAAAPRSVRCAVVSLVATLASAAALACGHCVEDRIAAVYDHALVQRTLAGKHQVAYFAWDGPTERSEAVRMKMLALGEATTGVDKGSVRVAMDPAAIAVAFDPRRTSAEAVAAALQKKLGALKLSLIPLQPPRAGAP